MSLGLSDINTVHTALLTCIEMLVSENASLKAFLAERKFFWIEDIQHDDKLVSSYTAFTSFDVYKSFSFLGPAFDCLNYWGEKDH